MGYSPGQQIQAQQIATKVVDKLDKQLAASVEAKPQSLENQVADMLIESGVFWWVIGFALIGGLYVFRKKILDLLGVEVKRKTKK